MTHPGARAADLLINTFVWYSPLSNARLERGVAKAAEFGFDGVELPIENPGDWDPGHAARLLGDHGLSCAVGAVMPPGRELVATDEPTLRRTKDYVRSCVDAAAAVGARMVSGPLYASVGRVWRTSPEERAALIAELRDNLQPLADYAAAAGVQLGVEPLNRYETSLVSTAAQAMGGAGWLAARGHRRRPRRIPHEHRRARSGGGGPGGGLAACCQSAGFR